VRVFHLSNLVLAYVLCISDGPAVDVQVSDLLTPGGLIFVGSKRREVVGSLPRLAAMGLSRAGPSDVHVNWFGSPIRGGLFHIFFVRFIGCVLELGTLNILRVKSTLFLGLPQRGGSTHGADFPSQVCRGTFLNRGDPLDRCKCFSQFLPNFRVFFSTVARRFSGEGV